jgi:hypothetical protein
MEPALVSAIAARPPGITGDSEFSCARAGVQRERYGRKPSASCASHLPGVPQGNALHRLKVRPSHVPVRPMRRRRSHAIVRRTCLDERRIAAAETAIRSLAGLIGNRNQSSSSIHSVPRHYRMRQWTAVLSQPCRVTAVDPLAAPPTLHIMTVVVHGIAELSAFARSASATASLTFSRSRRSSGGRVDVSWVPALCSATTYG